MRLQLFLGFGLVIAVVVGLTWFLAIRRTDAEFAVLVSEANQQQAQLVAPAILETYLQAESWEPVQTGLRASLASPPPFQAAMMTGQNFNPGFRHNNPRERAVVSLEVNFQPIENQAWPAWMRFFYSGQMPRFRHGEAFQIGFPPNYPTSQPLQTGGPPLLPPPADGAGQGLPNQMIFIVGADGQTIETGGALFVPSQGLPWVAANLRLQNQRLLVVDAAGQVVVDTADDLIGESLHAEDSTLGVPLYVGERQVGTLLLTTQAGVYTVEQAFFLNQIREGLLLSGLLSAGVALLLALLFAQYITRPLRALQAATHRLRAGEWGYQVDFRAKNELGDLALAFNALSQDLAAQRNLRAQLVKDLAHELNTPLSLMHLELQGMADGLQSPEEAAQHLKQELGEVSSLVADLVFLSQEDNGRPPRLEKQALNDLVALCVRRFESSHPGLAFLPAPTGPQMLADAEMSIRAISNLISNAIQHTPPEGRIQVRTGTDGGRVVLSVEDTGRGIPPEHLPHIFERFYRVDPSRTRQSGGRGLGLAIVKQIMEQHGGEVQVSSQLGAGSQFRLSWPAA